jgi:hypothetical protein
MATQSAVITFGLPEDLDSDLLLIEMATVKDGTYAVVASVAYEYGTCKYEYDSLDDTKWYRIRFQNSTDSEYGPYSDQVFGGDFSKASPFLAVSTTTDGAYYSTIQDVYEYSGLTSADASTSKVSNALKRARAVIDLNTAELDLENFDMWDTAIARKKYNATLHILKEAEINIAVGNLYKRIADDIIIEQFREVDNQEPSVSIGSTALGDRTALKLQSVPHFLALSNRYLTMGAAMISSIQPRSLRLTRETSDYLPQFKYPFNGLNK